MSAYNIPFVSSRIYTFCFITLKFQFLSQSLWSFASSHITRPVGSCVTGGGGGGDGTCSSDGSSCSTDDQCKKCVGGKNDGNVCSVASDCNKGGGVCTPGTCNNTGGGPTPSTSSPSESPSDVPSDSPSKSPTQSSTPCGSDPSKTVEITDGSLSPKYNGEYYRFADNTYDILKEGAGKHLDIKQSGAYNHPFRLCAGGLVGEDVSNTPCVPTDQDKCGVECVDYVISDTNRDNTCNIVLMPPSGVPVWYVCKVNGHNMYNQVY